MGDPPKPDNDNLFADGWAEANPEEAVPTDDVKRYIHDDYKAAMDTYDYRYRSYLAELHYGSRRSCAIFQPPSAEWV